MTPLRKHKPILLINCKNYTEASGNGLARIVEESLENAAGVSLFVAPPSVSLQMVAACAPRVQVLAQHIDVPEKPASTGWLAIDQAIAAGAIGTLINHAEHQLSLLSIKERVDACKQRKISSIVCTPTMRHLRQVVRLRPTMIAYEPPELIGGTISVTSANPTILTQAAAIVKKYAPKTMLLCGAGVKTGEDAAMAIQLGCKGILVASGIVTAKNPGKIVKEMANGMRKDG